MKVALASGAEGLEASKGTIRFSPEKPLPAGLVRRIVKARIKENEARARRSGRRAGAG